MRNHDTRLFARLKALLILQFLFFFNDALEFIQLLLLECENFVKGVGRRLPLILINFILFLLIFMLLILILKLYF